MTEERISWIDTAKAICMILIYMYHAEVKYGTESELLFNLRSPFFVNTFFFLSGYLLCKFNPPRKKILGNALLNIYLPTVLFAALLYIPKTMLRNGTFGIYDLIYQTVGGGAFWFTSALITAQLLWCIGRHHVTIAIFEGIAILCVCGNNQTEGLPMHFDSGMYSMLFMAFGYLFCRYEERIKRYQRPLYAIIATAMMTAAIAVYGRDVLVDVGVMKITWPGLPISFVSITAFATLCRYVPQNRYLSFVGQHTLAFYLLSGAVPEVLSIAVHGTMIGKPGVIAVWLLSIVVSYLLIYGFTEMKKQLSMRMPSH